MNTEIEKIATLEANYNSTLRLINKLDATLSKITEVSSSISQMLAVHESRLNQQEKDTFELARSTEKEMAAADYKIQRLKDNFSSELKVQFDELNENLKVKDTEYDTRFKKLEIFRYILLGGGIVIGFIVTKLIPIAFKFFIGVP